MSTFYKHGFLSQHEFNEREAAISKAHSEWFGLVDDLNQEAMRICCALQPIETRNRQMVAKLIYYRALQSFQGAVLLAKRGMPADALTLVRSCAESAIALGGVAHDEQFIATLMSGYNKHLKAFVNAHLGDTGFAAELTEEEKELGRGLVEPLNGVSLQGVKWDALATKVGMEKLYNIVYRSTSGDAAHVTLGALMRHVYADTDGKEEPSFQPDTRDIEQTISMAILALLQAMEKLNLVVPVGTAFLEYVKRLDALVAPSGGR